MSSRRGFAGVLALIALVGLGIRLAYVVGEKWDEPMVGDQIYYNAAANNLARGEGFVVPFDPDDPLQPGIGPAADHPPFTIMVIAPVSWLAHQNPNAQRLAMAMLGVAVVVAIGYVGRAISGDRTGWIAAGIAALYPNLWVNDALIMSETLAALTVALALGLTYRLLRRPTIVTALGLGAVCGLAALTRAELILLVVGLAVPAVIVVWYRQRAECVQAIVVTVVAAAVVIGPWAVFNLGRFQKPTFLSTNEGIALLGSNCEPVYSGDAMGLTDLGCLPDPPPPGDQSVLSADYRYRAARYARDHADRLPPVALARVGRVWSVYRPADMLTYNIGEGRERWVTYLGLVAYYPLVVLAALGLWTLRRSVLQWWPLLVPVAIVTVAAVVTYGQTRFRVPAEPSIVLLAAVAINWVLPGALVDRAARSRARAAAASSA
ncbi:MAG TPA: glycosyltransferase family 39 protein [Acidimicrobiia bacterium]|nr:glycosyltransferase family 39 protein [Acidimicrobiia bacterium]